ncbi:MAG: hypothetical protein ACRETD_06470, partial [Steroidobacteraceae bacterium]
MEVAGGVFRERGDWLVTTRGLRTPGKKHGFCSRNAGRLLGEMLRAESRRGAFGERHAVRREAR